MESSTPEDAGWERLFWSVFERSTNGIWLLDEDRRVIDVNAAGCKLFGASREEIIGERPDRFMTAEARSRLASEWPELWESGDWLRERMLEQPDGSHVLVQFAVQTGTVGGRRIAVVVCVRAEREDGSPPVTELGALTPREREIVSCVALGRTSSEIAEQLVISTETVRTHVRNAMTKTGAKTRAQLVAMALADRHIVDGP